jgi:hypothetical protein
MTEGYGKWLEQAREGGLPREALDDLAKLEKRWAEAERAILDALADVPIDFSGKVVLNVYIAADGSVTVEREPAP